MSNVYEKITPDLKPTISYYFLLNVSVEFSIYYKLVVVPTMIISLKKSNILKNSTYNSNINSSLNIISIFLVSVVIILILTEMSISSHCKWIIRLI